MSGARRSERTITAAAKASGDRIDLICPAPGLFRVGVRPGDLVRPGGALGELEVLGQRLLVVAPDGARGAVVAVRGEGQARPAADFGAVLVTLDPAGVAGEAAAAALPGGGAGAAASAAAAGRVFRAPTSGRFYGRQGPDKPVFVSAGDELTPGATVCLLEVMKTFHRVTYAGEPARVREVLIADGADVNAGDALLALE